MNPYFLAGDIINWLNLQVGQRNVSSWTVWRNYIAGVLHEDSGEALKMRIRFSQSLAKARKYTSHTLNQDLSSLNDADALLVLEAVELYLHIYTDKVVEKQMRNHLNDISSGILSLETNTQRMVLQYKDYLLTPPLLVNKSWFPMLIVWVFQFLFIFLLVAKDSWGYNNLFPMINEKGLFEGAYFFLNYFILFPLLFVFLYIRNNWVLKKTQIKLEPYYNYKPKVKAVNNPWQYLLLLIIFFLDVLLIQKDQQMQVFTMNFVAKGIFYYWVYSGFSLSVPSLAQIIRIKESNRYLSNSIIDDEENDQEIILYETRLKINNSRQDSYMLESALLGALAFSGVLQIIAADNFDYQYTLDFISTTRREFLAFILNFASPTHILRDSWNDLNGLQSWICFLSLMCSALFLVVIASRIGFSKIYENAIHSLDMAKFYNNEEEKLKLQKLDFSIYTQKIQDQLQLCSVAIENLEKVIGFMDFFRSMGVLSFFSVVFLASRYMGNDVFLVLILIYIIHLVFSNRVRIENVISNIHTVLEEGYLNYKKRVEIALGIAYALSIIITSFIDVQVGLKTQGIVFFSVSFWLAISHFFPDSEKTDKNSNKLGYKESATTYWIRTKGMQTGIAMIMLYFGMKINHIDGAEAILLLSILPMLIGTIYTKNIKSNNLYLRILTSLTLIVAMLSVVFKVMHFPLANELFILDCLLIPLLFVSIRFRFSIFTLFTRRVLIIFGIILLLTRGLWMSIHFDINPKSVYAGYVFGELRSQIKELLDSDTYSGKDKAKIYAMLDSAVTVIAPVQDHLYLKRNEAYELLQYALFVDSTGVPIKLLKRFRQLEIDSTNETQMEVNAKIDQMMQSESEHKQKLVH